MDQAYWFRHWRQDRLPWHQPRVEPKLVRHFSRVAPTRVLVPLCGKSQDLLWLAARGHEVIGVEFNPEACKRFFSENGLKAGIRSSGRKTVFSSGRISIINGDFFALDPARLGKIIGAVYDRAALIALPESVRPEYADRIGRIARPSRGSAGDFRFLQIVIQGGPQNDPEPPFSVSRKELGHLYGAFFRIRQLSRERVILKGRRASQIDEVAYRLHPIHW